MKSKVQSSRDLDAIGCDRIASLVQEEAAVTPSLDDNGAPIVVRMLRVEVEPNLMSLRRSVMFTDGESLYVNVSDVVLAPVRFRNFLRDLCLHLFASRDASRIARAD